MVDEKDFQSSTADYIQNLDASRRPSQRLAVLNGLTQAHRDYLVRRHGTVDLDPLPTADPSDPLNWPTWKKSTNIFLVAFQAFASGFVAAGIIPAFELLADDLGASQQRISYLVSLCIACYGWAPFLWTPISDRFGRRPVFLLSTFMGTICNIGGAVSKSYGALAATRCLYAFFISPAIAVGSGVVVETAFKKDRGKYMGIWTSLTTLGPPAGPFFCGFISAHLHYKWIFWLFTIITAIEFLLYIPFGPESRFERAPLHAAPTSARPSPILRPFKREYLSFTRVDPRPLSLREFTYPFTMIARPTVALPAFGYGWVFAFASVFNTTILPQLYIPKFHFGPQQIGLQFLGLILGTIIGEQAAGPLSDAWIAVAARRRGGKTPRPEFRLWVSYLGYAAVIVGLVIFCVQTRDLAPQGYNVSPIAAGQAIAMFGNQVITTVLITFAVDCQPSDGAAVGTFINMSRMTLGFLGPFWYPQMVEKLGLGGSAGLMVGIIVAVSIIPTIFLQVRGGARGEKKDKVVA